MHKTTILCQLGLFCHQLTTISPSILNYFWWELYHFLFFCWHERLFASTCHRISTYSMTIVNDAIVFHIHHSKDDDDYDEEFQCTWILQLHKIAFSINPKNMTIHQISKKYSCILLLASATHDMVNESAIASTRFNCKQNSCML